MTKTSWIIGTDPSCDIVVKNNIVSSQHCRLTLEDGTWTLTDLDSTNGTYVNGTRIAGKKTVQTTDHIRLGQTQVLPWPESIAPQDRVPDTKLPVVITIGRGSDNIVVLEGTNISTHHARLVIDEGNIILEDLGSTNGTSVGTIENKINRTTVSRTDQVYFGSTAYLVADLIRQTDGPKAAPIGESPVDQAQSPSQKSIVPSLLIASALLLVGLLVGSSIFSGDKEGTEKQPLAESNALDPAKELVDAKPSAPVDLKEQVEPKSAPSELSLRERLQRSLFVIICADKDRKTPFQVGTAFAIDSEHVVTSAAVVEAIRELSANGFPRTYMFSPASNTEIKLASMAQHPRYVQAGATARQAQQRHDRIYDELESKPPKPELFDAVKEQLIEARIEALQAIDEKAVWDTALLKVDTNLEHWLPIASKSLRPNQKLTVTGHAFDFEDPYFDMTSAIIPRDLECRVVRMAKTSAKSDERLISTSKSDHSNYAFLGSPVLTEQGEVIGVYSRPTPVIDGDESKIARQFDAAFMESLTDYDNH